MWTGQRWSLGVFAFYAGVAGGAGQSAAAVIHSLPLTPSDILPVTAAFAEGAIAGALIGAAIAWIRNLFLP